MIYRAKCYPTPSEGADAHPTTLAGRNKRSVLCCVLFFTFFMKMHFCLNCFYCSCFFFPCMGCESIMNKAILGSARH